jgi:hypothetical protein
VPQEIGARTTWFKERGLNAPAVEEAVEPEDETPPSNADAFVAAVSDTAREALVASRELPKDNVSGAATSDVGKKHRADVTEGLKNVRDRVEALLGCAGARLGLFGDVEKGESAPPGLDEVVVVAGARAPGARPEDVLAVPKRQRPSYAQVVLGNGTTDLEMKFEDGNAAFDAPVTPAENVDNQEKLLAFINNDVSGQLPLDYEKKLVADNGTELTPRMKTLAIKGSLSRLLEVAEGKLDVNEKNPTDTMARAKDEIRVQIRSCTEETKGLPLPLCVLATPGSREYSDGSSKTVFESPSLTSWPDNPNEPSTAPTPSWPINGAVDNLAAKADQRSALCTAVTFRGERGQAANRNAGTLLGGQGSSGGRGNKLPNSTNAERRWAVKGLKSDTNAHQAIVASVHEHFVHGVSGPSALQMNEWTERKARRGTAMQYEIFMGKLRVLPPSSALIASIRIFGDNGVIARGVPAGADEKRLWDQFLGDDAKKNITAAYLFLHALRFADYENILKDQSRRVLPILTDHSMREFYAHVFFGLATLMEDANRTRPVGLPKLFSVQTIERTKGTVRILNAATSEWEVPGAESSVKMIYRVLTMLSPFHPSQRGALTRVVGKEVTHGITVRQSLERTLASPRITGGYVADLKEYRKASVTACGSLVHSAEHVLRLPVGAGKKRILEEKKSLRDRSDDGETTLSKILKTKAVNVDDESFVHFMFLRLSQEETAESLTRLGFAVQLDMLKSQLDDDRKKLLHFPEKEDTDADAHQIVYVFSVRSRLAADPLDQPVAIFEEDPNSDFRLPDLSTMKTATVGDAMKVALEAMGENRGGRLVTMSAMYSDRITLEEFMHVMDGAPRGVRVVGFDALDMRPLLSSDFFPEIALGNTGWKRRMIHVEKGYAGHAFVVHRLAAALAVPCDLDVLRRAGMEAANQARTVPDGEKTEKNLKAVADRTAKPLVVFMKDVVPCWFGAAQTTLVAPTLGVYGRENNTLKVTPEKSTALLRHSGVEQLWRSQHILLGLMGDDVLSMPKVYLRPFPATRALSGFTDSSDAVVVDSWVSNVLWADGVPTPRPPAPGRVGKFKDIMSANFFASMSRVANPGILEHARDTDLDFYLCLADVAIAVRMGELDDAWVRPDVETSGDDDDDVDADADDEDDYFDADDADDGWAPSDDDDDALSSDDDTADADVRSHPFARRLNVKNDYVHAVIRALRDGGHLPHRYLLGYISALGTAGAAIDSATAAAA